jgi:hypothetical protein
LILGSHDDVGVVNATIDFGSRSLSINERLCGVLVFFAFATRDIR